MRRKFSVVMIVAAVMLVFTLGGCRKVTKNSIEKVADYEKIELTILDSYQEKMLFQCEAVSINSLNYTSIENLIEITNLINGNYKKINPLNIENWNEDLLQLIVEYRAENNATAMGLSSSREISNTVNGGIKTEGNNIKVIYDFNETVLKPVSIDGTIYFPIDIIKFYILNGESLMLRTGKYEYVFGNYFYLYNSLNISDDMYNDNLQLSVDVLKEYLVRNTGLDSSIELSVINSYEDYLENICKIIDSFEDYHGNISYPNKAVDENIIEEIKSTSFNEKLLSELEDKGLSYEFEGDNIQFNKLNNETMYLKINTFMDNREDFITNIQNFASEYKNDKEIKNVIVDLRNNNGGEVVLANLTMDLLMLDQYSIKIANMYNGDVFSREVLTTKKKNPIEDNKEFIVITNEATVSAAVYTSNIIKQNLNAKIIGREPLYKKTRNINTIQLIDGTFISISNPNYYFMNDAGINVDETNIVDIIMSDEEIEEYINKK